MKRGHALLISLLLILIPAVGSVDIPSLATCIEDCDDLYCPACYDPNTVASDHHAECYQDCYGASGSSEESEGLSYEEYEEAKEDAERRLRKALRERAIREQAMKEAMEREIVIQRLSTEVNQASKKMKDLGLNEAELRDALENMDRLASLLYQKGDYENLQKLAKLKQRFESGLGRLLKRKGEIIEEQKKEKERKEKEAREKATREEKLRNQRQEELGIFQSTYSSLSNRQLTDYDNEKILSSLEDLNKVLIKERWKYQEQMKLADEKGKQETLNQIIALEDSERKFKDLLSPDMRKKFEKERTARGLPEIERRLDEYLELRKTGVPEDVVREINNWILDPTITPMDPELRQELNTAKKTVAETIDMKHQIKDLENQAKWEVGVKQEQTLKKVRELKRNLDKKEQEAMTRYGRILIDHPGDEEANFALGTIYRNKGKNNEARILYRRALMNSQPIAKYKMKQELSDQQFLQEVQRDLNFNPSRSSVIRKLGNQVDEKFQAVKREIYARVRHSEIVSRGITYSKKAYNNYQTVKGLFTTTGKEKAKEAGEP